MNNRFVGKKGEHKAWVYLKKRGYCIRDINFHTRLGELDIVAEKNNTIVFVEVKARVGENKGKPYEAVTYRKLTHLKRAIHYYVMKHKLVDRALRIDVISIEFTSDNKVQKLQHFENVEIV